MGTQYRMSGLGNHVNRALYNLQNYASHYIYVCVCVYFSLLFLACLSVVTHYHFANVLEFHFFEPNIKLNKVYFVLI